MRLASNKAEGLDKKATGLLIREQVPCSAGETPAIQQRLPHYPSYSLSVSICVICEICVRHFTQVL